MPSGFTPPQARAQNTVVTLVSNTGQTSTNSPPVFASSAVAQRFDTGSKATLQSVNVDFKQAPSTPGNLKVQLWSNQNGRPNAKLADLSNPDSISDNSITTFLVSPSVTLENNSGYWLVFSYTLAAGESVANGDAPSINQTTSNSQDSSSQQGWTIADNYYYRPRTDTGPWTSGATSVDQAYQIQLQGTQIFPPRPIALNPVVLSPDGSLITVKFDKDLRIINLPSLTTFSVTADGVAIRKSGLSVNAHNHKQLLVTFSPNPIRTGQSVTVAYEDPTAGDDANAIQGTDGYDTEDFTLSFTSTTGPQPSAPSKPRNLSATADGPSRIDLKWKAPSDNGGRVITGYRIQSSLDGSSGSLDRPCRQHRQHRHHLRRHRRALPRHHPPLPRLGHQLRRHLRPVRPRLGHRPRHHPAHAQDRLRLRRRSLPTRLGRRPGIRRGPRRLQPCPRRTPSPSWPTATRSPSARSVYLPPDRTWSSWQS